MSLAESISERLSYKAHSSGVITAGSEPTLSSNPGASGAQQLRFVDHNLSITKDNYQSNEKRTDRQISDFRHGTKRAPANLNGLLSPNTYGDLLEAAFRGTWAAAVVTGDQSDFTSAAADATLSTITFAGGNPHNEGFRVGDVVRFTDLSAAANNSTNFVILAMGGTSTRTWTVYPAPTTMTADTSFSLTTVGRSLYVPSSSHVSRLFAFESYQEDLDSAEVFSECRIGGFTLGLPATGNVTCGFNILGRNRTIFSSTNSPFFTSPTAQTTTGICAAVNGLLRVNGENLGVVTALNLTFDATPQGPAVVGTNLIPEIFLGAANVTGDFSAFFEDTSLVEAFDDETEIELLVYLTTSSDAAAEAITIYLPRIKLGGATKTDDASGGKIIAYPFQALKLATAADGKEATTIRITDTEVT
jgi:hypothetical protein